MGIIILTDSTADIPVEIMEKYNISELPLTVHFGEEEYRDRVDITSEVFYEYLTAGDKLPTTSQVNPSAFAEFYKREIDKGNSIISIHISSDLSGTYNSAMVAKNMVKSDRISVIDSRSATLALGFVVIRAAQLVEKGLSHEEIVDEIEAYKNNVRVLIVVDTLEYLKKGGRLSGAQAMVGTMLNIKPILTIKDGKVVVIDKVRGAKKALNRIIEIAKENGNDISNRTVGIANARCPETAEELKEMIREEFPGTRFIEGQVGSVIATHVGPGAYGLVID